MEKTLNVVGMHCHSCEMLLQDAISEIGGVVSVKADSKKGTVTVVCNENLLDAVRKAVRSEGYTVID